METRLHQLVVLRFFQSAQFAKSMRQIIAKSQDDDAEHDEQGLLKRLDEGFPKRRQKRDHDEFTRGDADEESPFTIAGKPEGEIDERTGCEWQRADQHQKRRRL